MNKADLKNALREKRQLTILAIVVAMAGGFLLLRWLPLRSAKAEAMMQRQQQKMIIEQSVLDGAMLRELNKQCAELSEQLSDFDDQIPSDRQIGPFLQEVSDLMKSRELSEQVIQPGEEIHENGLCCVPVEMHCRGGLEQIFEFFKALGSMQRLVRFEQVRLTNDHGFDGDVSMRTRAYIYYEESAEGKESI